MKYNRNDENYVYYFIGKNIAKYRKEKGWTQEELADKAMYSKQFISNIENNVHQTFALGTLWKLAQVLEIDMYKLCIEEDNKKKGNLHCLFFIIQKLLYLFHLNNSYIVYNLTRHSKQTLLQYFYLNIVLLY